MVQEERSLNEKLDEALTLMKKDEKPKKEKKFDFPFGIKFGAKGKIRKNNALVQTISDNGETKFKFVPINDGMIYIKETDTYHMATATEILRYKNYPLIILPTFDTKPFSLSDRFEKADKEGRTTYWQKYFINIMNNSAIKPKMQLSGKVIFLIIIGIVLFVGFMIMRGKVGGG